GAGTACSPALRVYRVTVSRWTPTSRPVWRAPHPSATCRRTAVALSLVRGGRNNGVPLRSEKRPPQERHRRERGEPSLPYGPATEGRGGGLRRRGRGDGGRRNRGGRGGRGRPRLTSGGISRDRGEELRRRGTISRDESEMQRNQDTPRRSPTERITESAGPNQAAS